MEYFWIYSASFRRGLGREANFHQDSPPRPPKGNFWIKMVFTPILLISDLIVLSRLPVVA
jgi:hypothetical protein